MNRRKPPATAEGASIEPDELCEAGHRLRRAGQPLEAANCCRQALALDEAHPDSLHLMGLLSLDAGQHDIAVEWIARAIERDPKVGYLASLGTALRRQGRFEDALKTFDKAVQLQPDDAGLWDDLGNVLIELERPADAVLSFRHALELAPGRFDAALKCARLLYELGRPAEALPLFDLCDTLRPDSAVMLRMRALCHRSLRRFDDYLADSRRAYTLDPSNADTCNNIGDALQALGREEEALQWFDRALALLPDNTKVLNNKAFSLSQIQRFGEAVAIYHHVKTIDPDDAAADWNLALLLLLKGDFAAGWPAREARWRVPGFLKAYPRFPQPVWHGKEPIAGKTILIHVDEGLGDTIQFARYVPMVAARSARVILVVAAPLVSLLSGLEGVAQCLPVGHALPAFDLQCPISSLPLAFATTPDTIPAAVSYLPAPPPARREAWEQRLGPRRRPRIGLVWSGSLTHKNDHNRSIPLQGLSRILALDATFVSLQKDPRPADCETLHRHPEINDWTADLTDFGETAALISCLDLVISVDTSVAHLAAALGRPTWVLLPYTPDYRWLLAREDSPWYPTVRLFRQSAARDYGAVLERVRHELVALIDRHES